MVLCCKIQNSLIETVKKQNNVTHWLLKALLFQGYPAFTNWIILPPLSLHIQRDIHIINTMPFPWRYTVTCTRFFHSRQFHCCHIKIWDYYLYEVNLLCNFKWIFCPVWKLHVAVPSGQYSLAFSLFRVSPLTFCTKIVHIFPHSTLLYRLCVYMRT